jgi:hypothetical protein
LRDLKDLFERSVQDFDSLGTSSNRYVKNMINIPVLSGNVERKEKQTQYVVAALDGIIAERQRFGEKCAGIIATIREARKAV